MINLFLAVYVPNINGLPVVVGALAIGLGIAAGQVLGTFVMRRRQAARLRSAQESGVIGKGGFVTNTYSKWGAFVQGYLLVDSEKVIVQDKNKNTIRELRRSDIESVTYKDSFAHNFSLTFTLRDASSLKIYTFRPAPGNPYITSIVRELAATKAA